MFYAFGQILGAQIGFVSRADQHETQPVACPRNKAQCIAVFGVERYLAGEAGNGIGNSADNGALVVELQAVRRWD